VLPWTSIVGPGVRRLIGPPFSGVLDWGQVGKGTVWPAVVVVFFEHATDFPY